MRKRLFQFFVICLYILCLNTSYALSPCDELWVWGEIEKIEGYYLNFVENSFQEYPGKFKEISGMKEVYISNYESHILDSEIANLDRSSEIQKTIGQKILKDFLGIVKKNDDIKLKTNWLDSQLISGENYELESFENISFSRIKSVIFDQKAIKELEKHSEYYKYLKSISLGIAKDPRKTNGIKKLTKWGKVNGYEVKIVSSSDRLVGCLEEGIFYLKKLVSHDKVDHFFDSGGCR